jgi:hypothetical protein
MLRTATRSSQFRFEFLTAPLRRRNDKHRGYCEREPQVSNGKNPPRQIIEDQPIRPIAEEIMRVTNRSTCRSQTILEGRQRTLDSHHPFDTNEHDRREMRDTKAGVAHPCPSSRDSREDQRHPGDHKENVTEVNDRHAIGGDRIQECREVDPKLAELTTKAN